MHPTKDPETTVYRGYALVTDEVGTDIWHGPDYIETHVGPTSLDAAKKQVDVWTGLL